MHVLDSARCRHNGALATFWIQLRIFFAVRPSVLTQQLYLTTCEIKYSSDPALCYCNGKHLVVDSRFTSSQKHAIMPLLKKVRVDAADMCNYRPVSNLTFKCKDMERLAATQLHQYLAEQWLCPLCCVNSRPTAGVSQPRRLSLTFLSEAFTTADEQQLTPMGLRDLSATFDCVNHELCLLLHGISQWNWARSKPLPQS